jgi:sugar phosphate isomerase/epimerase
MYGISTCWRSAIIDDGHELLDRMLDSGLNSLEVDYRISEKEFLRIKKRLKSGEFTVLTVHNFCPIPEGISKDKASGDVFLLSSPDPNERQVAVKFALKTLHHAADMEARVVVFHLGQVDMDDDKPTQKSFYEKKQLDSEEYESWKEQKLAERAQKAQPNFDAIMKSLDQLNEEACRLGLFIGAENRYRYHQIPFQGEFDVIFSEFAGGNIRYWHDVGHGDVLEQYKFYDQEKDLLRRYQKHLVGMHIHDIRDMTDHLAPGTGGYDFTRLLPYLTDDTVRILEIHNLASAEQVRAGVEILLQKGILK